MTGKAFFCFGLGYSAGFLARQLHSDGWRIAGTTRDAPLGDEEFTLHRFSRADLLVPDAYAEATHVLISIPPDEEGCPVLDMQQENLIACRRLEWVGYLSTTNVYGDRGGGWVDEDSPLRPSGIRGQRRVSAEAGWRDLWRKTGLPVHVFRLAGIYGPGRNALVALKAGAARRIVKPGQVFSRIHVADLAAVLRASMAQPRPGAVYNVCDDEAAPPDAVITYAAALLGLPAPQAEDFATADLSPLAKSFYADNKRVSNRRLKDELGVTLRYPTYREGLAALNRAEI
jgi:nucleoside-diphosphate-sugar epimerase